ncbi:MAG TPA: hypothetical protein VL651_11335 [Bacteroidia bacterium]|jgi:hypothetical protein|nr:hypothetical protein [Bacteroidia bacterium]
MTRKLCTVIFILFCLVSNAQVNRSVFGIGPMGGVNSVYADGGVSIETVLYSHFDINAGIATRRYQGAGLSVGWRYYPLGIKYFSPLIGVNLMMIGGRTFSVSHNGFFSVYSTPQNQYVISEAGIMYSLGQLDFLLMGDYSLAKNEVHTQNQSGFADPSLMKCIDDRINGGWGVTFGIMFRPWRNVTNHTTEFGRN